jgi:glycine cleavage system H protein
MVAIFVALMFVGFVLADLVLQKIEARRAVAVRSVPPVKARQPEGMEADGSVAWGIPEGVCLCDNHTWLKREPAGTVSLGMDSFLAYALGNIENVSLPNVGDAVTAGRPVSQLRANGCVLKIPSSLTGKVIAVNTHLREHPELLTSAPFGEGWICKVVPARDGGPSEIARFGQEASMWLKRELERFSEFLSGQLAPDLALGVTSHDGGLPIVGSLAQLDRVVWSAFEVEFLRRS